MSDIAPPSLGLSGAATQATPAGVAGTVTNPPQAAAQLPSGAILHGTVIRLDGPHLALIRTDLGLLEVASHAQLAVGNQVTLQVRSAGSRLHVVIMQVDGQPAHLPPAVAGQAGGHSATAPSGGAADVLALGQRLDAIVQSPPPLPVDGQAPTRDGPLPAAGSRIQLRVVQVQAPGGPQAAPSTDRQPAVGATLTNPGKTGPGPTTPAGQTGPGPTTPAGQTGAGPTTPAGQTGAGRTVPAVVTGLTMAGEPVVETSLGILTLGLKAALPSGTRLMLELAGTGFAQGRTAVAPAVDSTALAFGWTALDEALEVLQRPDLPAAATPAARQSIPQPIPQPGPRLASTILFFLQALSGGDLGGWLGGRAVEALDRAGRGDLLSRLSRDFTQLARMSETAGGEWRLLIVPLLDGSHVQQLRLFVRRRKSPRGGNEADRAQAATRFILDVELSRFGDMQLDGLVRNQRFDLILRTRRRLSDEMRREITAIFNDANSLAGHQGQIGFQASGDWTFMAVDPRGDSGAGLLA